MNKNRLPKHWEVATYMMLFAEKLYRAQGLTGVDFVKSEAEMRTYAFDYGKFNWTVFNVE